jgi:hypothetical protein
MQRAAAVVAQKDGDCWPLFYAPIDSLFVCHRYTMGESQRRRLDKSLMRYVIDPEFRPAAIKRTKAACGPLSAALRQELSARNLEWARTRGHAHEVTLGAVPAVLYREDEKGVHGNFLDASYRAITATPAWRQRLEKVHTSARRALLSRDGDRRELDSSHSSDALLMNIFCHPATLADTSIAALLGTDRSTDAVFGYRPRIALKNSRRDTTEVDLKLGSLLIEAKLTESDFQIAPIRFVERYRDFEPVFDRDRLDIEDETLRSYQLIRGVLAANSAANQRYCVLCDARRADLIDAWHCVMMAVKPYDLRGRLQLLTWQELAAHLPSELQEFLYSKFGIC